MRDAGQERARPEEVGAGQCVCAWAEAWTAWATEICVWDSGRGRGVHERNAYARDLEEEEELDHKHAIDVHGRVLDGDVTLHVCEYIANIERCRVHKRGLCADG